MREGDFAIKLAALYGLGAPANETEAEDLLSSAGVIPLNGWISDYPVTPEILGQLQEAAARAASEGRLSMAAEKATQLLYDLASQMNLPVPAGPESTVAAAAKAPEQPAIYNYYTGYGPPIITYYPPPPAYFYLYAWVPYPVWWYGYWYPGFYMCNNFSTTVVVDSRTAYVRNRYVDPVTRRVVRVEPVVHTGRDTVRSETVLRTSDGRTFRNIREMRQGIVSGDVQHGGQGTRAIRQPGAGGFTSLQERRSAQDILRRSFERQGTAGQIGRSSGSVSGGDVKRRSPQSNAGGSYTGQPLSGQRSYERSSGAVAGSAGTPGRSQRSYDYPTRKGSGQFQGSAAGGGARPPVMQLPSSARPIPGQHLNTQRSHGWPGQGSIVSPAAPGLSSGQRSYTQPSRGNQGMSNSPRLSR
ncbi:MAG: hypothetical protein LUQ03_07170 [Methanomicrobiales archaeon]|nr:hypothetical protein [Methanomicrobiales archaeon]